MKIFGNTVHWIFAIVVSMIAYYATLLAFAVVFLKMQGLHPGGPVPPDIHVQNPMLFNAVLAGMLFGPLIASAWSGAITAPNAQRGVALVFFPALVFPVANVVLAFAGNASGFNMKFALGSGASCAAVGLVLIPALAPPTGEACVDTAPREPGNDLTMKRAAMPAAR